MTPRTSILTALIGLILRPHKLVMRTPPLIGLVVNDTIVKNGISTLVVCGFHIPLLTQIPGSPCIVSILSVNRGTPSLQTLHFTSLIELRLNELKGLLVTAVNRKDIRKHSEDL
jgi:hypothetical protein